MKYFGIVRKNLRPYFDCDERLEIFLTFFCNILCYVGGEALKIGDSMKISIFCKRDFLVWAKILSTNESIADV